MNNKVLIVDDEKDIRTLMRIHLERNNFICIEAEDRASCLHAILTHSPDIILLDVMLEGVDGFDLCKTIRETSNVPIIFVTAKDDVESRVHGLTLGADDYIVKPFSGSEVLARISAVMRRVGTKPPNSTDTITIGRLTIHERNHKVFVEGEEVILTLKEHELLKFLVKHERQIFTREQLLTNIWGTFYDGTERTVDTHIKTLRIKLKNCGEYIRTVWGVGYRFEIITKVTT